MSIKKESATSNEASFRGGYKDESGNPLTPSQTLSMLIIFDLRKNVKKF